MNRGSGGSITRLCGRIPSRSKADSERREHERDLEKERMRNLDRPEAFPRRPITFGGARCGRWRLWPKPAVSRAGLTELRPYSARENKVKEKVKGNDERNLLVLRIVGDKNTHKRDEVFTRMKMTICGEQRDGIRCHRYRFHINLNQLAGKVCT